MRCLTEPLAPCLRTVASRVVIVAILTAFAVGSLSGCGTIPDAGALIRSKVLYRISPRFVGARGPLTNREARTIISDLEARQHEKSNILQRHLAFEQALSDVPLVLGNKVTLLKNGPATYAAMFSAIESATSSINLEMYIFSAGPIGERFADALIDRQRHGVQVNIMYDSFGSLQTPASFFDRMRAAGVRVVQFNPLNPFETRLRWSVGHRNHRKLLVVDGRVAFTGGINISNVYANGMIPHGETPEANPAHWRDTDVEVTGPVVSQFQEIFIHDWLSQKGPPLSPREYFPPLRAEGDDIVRVIASAPEQFSLIYVTLISAIDNAETNVYITDAYFAPDHQTVKALRRAARRGVDVRLLLPSQSDVPLIVSAARSHYTKLMAAGVKIYEWRGEMLHAKTATIDGVWSTVGTSNLDWWSIARNDEINADIVSQSFGTEMNLMFRNDLEDSVLIDPHQWRDRGIVERTREFFAG
ncbi:MAG TPA: phospholipase D-like domain-containing protein, partial [Candidatus Binataceae bacterium]|nr:phospholipase D-like domain-containing protein [Candidatus Binataceae bacterium]